MATFNTSIKPQIKGNIGEWSEWYAFLKILSDRKMYAADKNIEKIEDKFFQVLKVIRNESKGGRTTYDISDGSAYITIFDADDNQVSRIPIAKIKSKVRTIFDQMKNSTETTFSIPGADETMRELRCSQIKAASNRKADLTVMIHDRVSPTYPELGFSVKSLLGAASTLLNASGATNFIFRLDGLNNKDIERINAIEGRSKIRDRMIAIHQTDCRINFIGLDNDHFKTNLRKSDTVLPDILAELLKCFFEGKGNTLPELVESLVKNEELSRKFSLSKGDYEFKLKNFLVSVALGMTPSKEWDGFTKAHGGYIIVKEDGEIVCYHLYNRDEFQEYLYNNTRLETPSTSRHQYGFVYKEGKGTLIKLNLQIRFIK